MKKYFFICCTILGYAFFCVPSFAAVKTWSGAGGNSLASTPGNWSGNVAPVANDSVMFDNTSSADCEWDINITVQDWTQTADFTGTVIFHTRYPGQGDFTEFVISGNCTLNNGVWTHPANAGAEVRRLSVAIYGNLTIGAAASIDLFGKGYQDARKGYTGPGGRHPGASHGGTGLGANPSYGGLASYGSITAPVNLGSGGSWAGNFGGGAMRLQIGGTVQHDGLICATASDANSYYMGSGGSIFITAGALAGGGTIRANGGTASGHSPGGGGRIALIVTNASADFTGFTGPIHASAGACGLNYAGIHAGTIYMETPDDPPGHGELLINNQGGRIAYYGCADLNDMETVTYEFSRITLINNATLRIGPGDTLILTNTMLHVSADSRIDIRGGTLVVPNNFTFSNILIRIIATNSTISPASSPSSLTVGTNAILNVDQQYSMHSDDVIVAPGGLITHTPNAGTELYKLDITVAGNFTVQEGGSVNVTGKGYGTQNGPGYITGNTAASHGGRGAPEGDIQPGPCYGSIIAPTNIGSGGRRSAGGGAIIMNVSGIIHNEGGIFANGVANHETSAGGSIFLTAGELTGNAAIQAHGGDSTLRRHGGGGRIALIVTNNGGAFSGYTGPITAFSGRQGDNARDGGAGTIYLQTAEQDPAEGTLIIDNDNLNNSNTTDVPPLYAPSDEMDRISFFISNAGTLRLTNDYTIGNIWLETENATLDLNFKTLTIKSMPHKLEPGTVINYGEIIWFQGALFRFF